MRVTVIVPAHQEAGTIETCLRSIIDQTFVARHPGETEVIVLANACADATVERARGLRDLAAARGLDLLVIDDPVGGKARALNRADALARGAIRVYLDADVACGPTLLEELAEALAGDAPRYASGTVMIPRSGSWFSRRYAEIWARLPFVASDVAGCGLYAVNAAGRRRWGAFPALHSDDKYVRLLFDASERRRVAAPYSWPVPDGLGNLLSVRRRWCEGNAELRDAFPELRDRPRAGSLRQYARLLFGAPVSAIVFSAVYGSGALLALGHARRTPVKWRRGR